MGCSVSTSPVEECRRYSYRTVEEESILRNSAVFSDPGTYVHHNHTPTPREEDCDKAPTVTEDQPNMNLSSATVPHMVPSGSDTPLLGEIKVPAAVVRSFSYPKELTASGRPVHQPIEVPLSISDNDCASVSHLSNGFRCKEPKGEKLSRMITALTIRHDLQLQRQRQQNSSNELIYREDPSCIYAAHKGLVDRVQRWNDETRLPVLKLVKS